MIGCPCLPRDNKVLECFGDMYWSYIDWYKHYFGEDTRNWFVMLFIRELVEIIVQIIAVYNYNGTNIFDNNQIILAAKPSHVKLFAILLCSNSISVGILWIFYIFQNKLCHGEFFKNLVFVIDTLFDTLYALFPIIIVTYQSGLNISYAIGSLQSQNMYVVYISLLGIF